MFGRQHPLLICSECGLVETDSESVVAVLECPHCRSKSLNRSRQDIQITSSRPSRPKFRTASRLRFDIEQTDSLAIDIGERVCLVGKCSTLINRLCITALLPERHCGFGSPHIIIIDAGNQSDIYECVNFARQYGLDIKDILRRIVVSRAFTIYQLVGLIINELPQVVGKFDTKVLIIQDMLHMFIDSQIRIDQARPLIKEITDSLRIFSKDMSVIVSLDRVPSPQYCKMLFPSFDRFIQINE
jgi:DNA-directed RNA polymerase subunit RPC12/RpoP